MRDHLGVCCDECNFTCRVGAVNSVDVRAVLVQFDSFLGHSFNILFRNQSLAPQVVSRKCLKKGYRSFIDCYGNLVPKKTLFLLDIATVMHES